MNDTLRIAIIAIVAVALFRHFAPRVPVLANVASKV
jgi:hypothetical protein